MTPDLAQNRLSTLQALVRVGRADLVRFFKDECAVELEGLTAEELAAGIIEFPETAERLLTEAGVTAAHREQVYQRLADLAGELEAIWQ